MIAFFVPLYVFVVSEWLMHTRYSFHYFKWLTLDSTAGLANSIVLFMAIELILLCLFAWLKTRRFKALAGFVVNLAFGMLLFSAVGSISYHKYRYAPYFSGLWTLSCIKCSLKESFASNLALLFCLSPTLHPCCSVAACNCEQMEKYSKWRDLGTGIHPFLSSKLHRKPRRRTASIFAWLSLKLLGFYLLVHENWSKKFKILQGKVESLKDGDIIFCNHVSWLDFLLFEYFYAPQFCYAGEDSKLLSLGSIFNAVFRQPANEYKTANESNCSLRTMVERCRNECLGPIVVFPESATTNGKALLSFQTNLDDVKDLQPAIYVSTIKYSGNIPPFVFGSMISNVHSVADNLFNYATLKIFPMASVLLAIEESNEYFNNSSLSNCLAYLARVKQVQLTAKSKQDFLAVYNRKSS